MKGTVGRLLILHLIVVALAVVGSFFLWGWSGSLASLAGALSFSLPVLAFSGLVVQASAGDPARFIGKFMVAELLKWVSSAVLLAGAFLVGVFGAQALLAGFFLSVLVQVFFPIFVPKASES